MKILLVCSAGMSTSMLVQKMEDYSKAQGLDDKIEALSGVEGKGKIKDFDVVLIAPQIRFEQKNFQELAKPLGVPVGLIDVRLYGTLNGEAVYKYAQQLVEDAKKA